MALPVILVDSTNGAKSDSLCSGAGPTTALSGTPGDTTASGANTVNAGDAVTWVFSANSSANDVAFTMKITRT